jgi:hypothetical protein
MNNLSIFAFFVVVDIDFLFASDPPFAHPAAYDCHEFLQITRNFSNVGILVKQGCQTLALARFFEQNDLERLASACVWCFIFDCAPRECLKFLTALLALRRYEIEPQTKWPWATRSGYGNEWFERAAALGNARFMRRFMCFRQARSANRTHSAAVL